MVDIDAIAFVKSYLDAWNERDAGAVMEHICPDGRYIDQAWQIEMTGPALLEELRDYFESYHYIYSLSDGIISSGNAIAFQYRAEPFDAGGQELTLSGADFITLRDGLCLEIYDYYKAVEHGEIWLRKEPAVRYAKSGLSQKALADLLSKIERAMSHDRLYLDADLSLPKLAARLDTSVNHLSQAINSGFHCNFFQFVNRYRVEAAAKLLESDTPPLKSTHEVALAVGFKSLSTFYTAFHKATGQAPGAYRRGVKTGT